MEYVGSGTDYDALPQNGGVPVDANQLTELNNGKIWAATTDHKGTFRVGGTFEVDQETGFVNIPAGALSVSTLLADLDLNGQEIVTNEPNQDIVLNPNGTGVVNVSTSRITNVVDPTGAQDAATKNYVDTELDNLTTATTAELNILDGATLNTSELNTLDGITASTSELNQLDGKTITTTFTGSNTNDIPTSSAINTYVVNLFDALGGFVAIPNETSFPNSNPDPVDGAGTVVSIADAGGLAINGSGVATGQTLNSTTVTINGFPSHMYNETLAAGLGVQVQTTSTEHTYTFHKLIPKDTDVLRLSDDINDFNNRYRVGTSNPTTDNDAGDLFFNTGTGKMLVYDAGDAAWEEVQSIGNFLINTISSSSGTGGGSATFNGVAYRFTLNNAGSNVFQHLVSINGVIQKPNAGITQPAEGFALDGADIIFSDPPATGSPYFIVTIGSTVNIGEPSNNTVTADKIVDGTITNAEISSSAAIAGTKISPNFGSQNVVTTGSLGVGTSSPQTALDVRGGARIGKPDAAVVGVELGAGATGDRNVYIDFVGDTTYTDFGFRLIRLGGENGGSLLVNRGTGALSFKNEESAAFTFVHGPSTERLRIDSSGRVGIGTSLPQEPFVVSNSGAEGIEITPGAASNTSLIGSYNRSTSAWNSLRTQASDYSFRIGTSPKLTIDSSGRVGIGVTSPGYKCDIDVTGSALRLNSTTSQALLVISSDDAANAKIEFGDESDNDRGAITYDNPNNALIFQANAAERFRCDSSGRLLVGTSSSSLSTRLQVMGNSASSSGTGSIYVMRGNDAIGSGVNLGEIVFTNYNGQTGAWIQSTSDAAWTLGSSHPTRINFATTAASSTSPTERLHIASTGAFGLSGANYGTSGQVLTSQGSGSAPQWATPSGWTEITATSLSGTEIQFTSLPSDWSELLVIWQDVQGSASHELEFQFGTSATYFNSGYKTVETQISATGASCVITTTTALRFGGGNWNGVEVSGHARIYNPAGNVYQMEGEAWSAGKTSAQAVRGWRDLGGALGKFRFYVDTGNFTAGNWKLMYI